MKKMVEGTKQAWNKYVRSEEMALMSKNKSETHLVEAGKTAVASKRRENAWCDREEAQAVCE